MLGFIEQLQLEVISHASLQGHHETEGFEQTFTETAQVHIQYVR